jgi:hypothetical protein
MGSERPSTVQKTTNRSQNTPACCHPFGSEQVAMQLDYQQPIIAKEMPRFFQDFKFTPFNID